jgi:uncharacterized protein YkwD
MQLYFKGLPRRLSSALFFSFIQITLLGGIFPDTAHCQTPAPRPVARLISETPSNSRPRRVSAATTAVSPASKVVPLTTLNEANPIERRAFEQTNIERAKNGLPPLVWDPDLCRMARSQSENMGRLGYLSHTPEGQRLRDRARAVGIAHYTILGENIAYNFGYDDPGGFAVERWMLSPGHRANILDTSFKAMAVGTFVAADGSVFLTQTFIYR